jgi:hypothetical protein
MGRELKRVPLKFNTPLKETWKGYVNPYLTYMKQCDACDGLGCNPEIKVLNDQWYGSAPFDLSSTGSSPFSSNHKIIRNLATNNWLESTWITIDEESQRLATLFNSSWCHHLSKEDVDALLKADRLWEFTRIPLTEEHKEIIRKKRAEGGNSWLPFDNGYIPTPQEVNDWSLTGFGHDSVNQWTCVKARAKREGVKNLSCPSCKGSGQIWKSTYYKRKANSWQPTEPPRGRGFQLWQTTKGSPISPVFRTLDALCEWAATNATTFGNATASAEGWKSMLSDGIVTHREGNLIFL